ncbi:MAG: O-acetyl-ADP-ribose deacetylase [Planctomycetes bacterium]|nr:O-acetyl-ADP-ribose deacetylase [Planctomycetota bacterium]
MSPDVLARVVVVKGDITRLRVDAIVNAANNTLLGGGGVDGAIHNAAGEELYTECLTLGGCETGRAKMTRGYALPAKHVIHTVGPVYRNGTFGEPDLLRSCYRESLELAAGAKLETIAFPCISTGIYGYPVTAACVIAVETVAAWLASNELPRVVTFCCFSEKDAALYRERLGRRD